MGLPRCKNLTRFSLFVSFWFAVRYCLKCFVSFVLRHPSVSFQKFLDRGTARGIAGIDSFTWIPALFLPGNGLRMGAGMAQW